MIFSRIKAAYFAVEFLISILLVVFFMWLLKKHIHAVRKFWGRSQRLFGFYSLEVVGNFDERANMIIMNHQSMLAIVVLAGSLKKRSPTFPSSDRSSTYRK